MIQTLINGILLMLILWVS